MIPDIKTVFHSVLTVLKWIAGVIIFPISIPYVLVRLFLKKTPTLSKPLHIAGSVGIVIGWFWLFSAFPSPPPAPQPQTTDVATTSSTVTGTSLVTHATSTTTATGGTTVATTSTGIATTPQPTGGSTDTISTSSAKSTGTASAATAPAQDQTTTLATSTQTTYAVVRVIDGDTVDLSIEGKTERIRMIGIDTPETVDPRKPVQCFGKEASDKLKALLSGKRVTLEKDPTQGDRDSYSRLLGYVFLEDGTNVNLATIQQGYAHEYTYRTPYKYQSAFKEAMASARTSKVGLWADDTCAGDTTKPAASGATSGATGTGSSTSGSGGTATAPSTSSPTTHPADVPGVVKKSVNDICHAPGTTYYERTKNYIPFETLEACLASGGVLPKR